MAAVTAPRARDCPSPKAMVTLRIARVVLTSVRANETGCPAIGVAGVGVRVMAVGASTVTVAAASAAPADAVTSAVAVVRSTVRASPLASVVARRCRSAPALAPKETRTCGIGFWLTSRTSATRVASPPVGGKLPGNAVRCTAATAAAPTVTCTVSLTALPE